MFQRVLVLFTAGCGHELRLHYHCSAWEIRSLEPGSCKILWFHCSLGTALGCITPKEGKGKEKAQLCPAVTCERQ